MRDFKLVAERDGKQPDPREYGRACVVTTDDQEIVDAVRTLLEDEFGLTVGTWRRDHTGL